MIKKGHFITAIIPLSIWALSSSLKIGEKEGNLFSKPKIEIHHSDTTVLGQQLALKYCQNCHLFPEPDLLDKKTWTTSVLPNMGLRLGIREAKQNPYADMDDNDVALMKEVVVYPEIPLISREEWLEIIKYYEKTAPSVLPLQKTDIQLSNQLPQFKAQYLTVTQKKLPRTTLLKYNKTTSLLYIGDAQNDLFVVDSTLRLKNVFKTESAPVDIDFQKNKSLRLLTIGKLNPSDQKLGQLFSLEAPSKTIINGLQRPVQFATGDINKDGKEDIVVSQFGHNTGKLSWFESDDTSKEHILRPLPGTRKVEIVDVNKDKKLDIIALSGQAWEGISIFYNQGKGKFKEKKVLQFSPVFGASYFECVDFNKDGFPDILLTNGDNWDYSAIFKPYHGVHIYLNDGQDNFKEAFFYPMYGTSKAVARDFDNDGDLDIVAISFYNDLDLPEQGFIYLENQGRFHFKAYSTPEAASGKWLTMEVGDFDKDGDEDIVLGSYFQTVGEMTKLVFKGVESFPQLLILSNLKK
jgi:FG-GAP-like repeat